MSTLVIALLLHWPFWLVVILVLVGLAHEWLGKKMKGRMVRGQELWSDINTAICKYNQKVKDTTKK